MLGQSVLTENKGLGNSILQQRPLGFIRTLFPHPSKCVSTSLCSDDGGLTVMPLRLHADLTIAFIINQRKPFNVYNQASEIRSNSVVLYGGLTDVSYGKPPNICQSEPTVTTTHIHLLVTVHSELFFLCSLFSISLI